MSPMTPLARSMKRSLVNLGSWSTTSTSESRNPSPDRRHTACQCCGWSPSQPPRPPSPWQSEWELHAPCPTAGRRDSASCRTLPPSSAAERSSPPRSSRHAARGAAAGDGSGHAARHAPPLSADKSVTCARTRRRRRPAPPRKRGGEPATSSPPSGPLQHSRSTCARRPPTAGMHSRSAAPCPRRYSRPP